MLHASFFYKSLNRLLNIIKLRSTERRFIYHRKQQLKRFTGPQFYQIMISENVIISSIAAWSYKTVKLHRAVLEAALYEAQFSDTFLYSFFVAFSQLCVLQTVEKEKEAPGRVCMWGVLSYGNSNTFSKPARTPRNWGNKSLIELSWGTHALCGLSSLVASLASMYDVSHAVYPW